MQDIYKPPESNLGTEKRIRPHGFWRFFFWFNVILSPLVMLMPFLFEGISIYDYLDLACFLPEILMIFGYAYSKRILNRLFWKAFFFFYLGWVIVYGLIMPYGFNMLQYGEPVPLSLSIILEIVFYCLYGYALFFYTYKSQDLWLKRD